MHVSSEQEGTAATGATYLLGTSAHPGSLLPLSCSPALPRRYMWWLPIVGRETITFVGEVDGSGHPSGYGEWRDSAWHGEHLTGFWHAGKPAGPFRSRETGSASSLVNLR